MPSSVPPRTLLEVARRAAAEQPERGFRFCRGGVVEQTLSYAALDTEARAMAAGLAHAGCRPGDRALLVFEPGLDFLKAFWACIYAGLVAVPAPPPARLRLERTLPRLARIARNCEPTVLLASPGLELPDSLGVPRWRGELSRQAEDWSPPAVSADSLALLQYTSGSTREPRGVCLRHSNLLHNLAMLEQFHRAQTSMVMVHWLPLFHDMGLIRGMLSPVHMRGDGVLLDPLEFVRRPLYWLRALSGFGATVTGAPDFGYALVCRKVAPADLQGLDFSALRVAFCSSEPIRAHTLRRFAALLAPHGLSENALKPAYGLAEATVMVSGEMGDRWRSRTVSRQALGHRRVEPAQAAEDRLEVVSCGQPLGHQDLRIVDPEGNPCASGVVGEIWLRGPSVSSGYWKGEGPDGWLAGGEGPFLRTGDLGWLEPDGSLSVCGRLKDLLIVHGQNLLAHDLEAALEERVPGLRPGCGAAFQVEQGVAVAYESAEQDPERLSRAIWAAAGEEFGLSLREILILAPGTLPKTSSGKVQRPVTAQRHQSGELPIRFHWRAPARPL